MRTAMRPRYYCDHCNKGSGSPLAMKRHESGCTANPKRVCRMCAILADAGGDEPAPPRDELRKILNAEGFPSMCKAANDCPACILSVIRQLNDFDDTVGPVVKGPYDGRQEWSYTKAKADWWAEFNSVDCRSYPV